MTFKYYKTTQEVLTLFVTALLEPFMYHPLIMFFSLKGYYSYITSRELAWGTMTRQGFDKKEGDKKNDNNKPNDSGKKENRPNIFQKNKKDESGGKFEPIKT